ncbi:hypothetical protein [Nocardia tengchongensis]|uniref:hypothetical protein n=1 Tax=Nocardia tengchongensis TaxID=2055889 RepID=UPI00369E1492
MTIVLAWLICFAPLTWWLLGARKRRVGLIVGSVLAVLGVTCFAVGAGWILESERITMLAALVLTMSAVLITGFVVDHRADGGGGLSVRSRAGMILGGATILVTTFFGGMLLLATNGQRASVPPDSELLPLPAGLVVLDNQSQRCGGNSSTVCGRIFEVGSTGISGSGSAAALVEHLGQSHGWPDAIPDRTPGSQWERCRHAGWGFDRHLLCVSVKDNGTTATVWFESSADN